MVHFTGLLFRAAVAILLMVLFFSLALTASAGLVYGAYELGAFTLEHLRGRSLVIFLLIAGGMGFGAWSSSGPSSRGSTASPRRGRS
ncbi:hypothetical protein ACN28S_48280 [Cystobacter fuscus]